MLWHLEKTTYLFRTAVLSIGLLTALSITAGCERSGRSDAKRPVDDVMAETFEGEDPPLKILDFIVYVTESDGSLREEIHAEAAYLHQQWNIAHLRRIHVDFHKPGTPDKDTLEAPEGYLYLADMAITPLSPFYKKILGENAITTYTFADMMPAHLMKTSPRSRSLNLNPEYPDGRPMHAVYRGQKDIDLIGTNSNKVYFRRPYEGTEVSCLRAWRNTEQSRLYGVGECAWSQPQMRSKTVIMSQGTRVSVDDRLSSGIRIRGDANRRPSVKVVPMSQLPGVKMPPEIGSAGEQNARAQEAEPATAAPPYRKAARTPIRRKMDQMAVPELPKSE